VRHRDQAASALLHALRAGRRPDDPVMSGWFDFPSGVIQLRD
jgi:hypothetical protein